VRVRREKQIPPLPFGQGRNDKAENKGERPDTSGPLDSRGRLSPHGLLRKAADFVEDWGLVGLLCCPPEE